MLQWRTASQKSSAKCLENFQPEIHSYEDNAELEDRAVWSVCLSSRFVQLFPFTKVSSDFRGDTLLLPLTLSMCTSLSSLSIFFILSLYSSLPHHIRFSLYSSLYQHIRFSLYSSLHYHMSNLDQPHRVRRLTGYTYQFSLSECTLDKPLYSLILSFVS